MDGAGGSARELLRILAGGQGLGGAHGAREAALASADREGALEALVRIASDRTRAPRLRAAALLAAAEAATLARLPLPAGALAVVDDPVLVDGAVRAGLVPALTGVLYLAPHDDAHDELRRLVARRILRAGARGPHVTRLLLDAGDRAAAARAAVDDFLANVKPRLDSFGSSERVWGELAAGWLARDSAFFVPFAGELRARDPWGPAALLRLIEAITPDPALRAAARAVLAPGPREAN